MLGFTVYLTALESVPKKYEKRLKIKAELKKAIKK